MFLGALVDAGVPLRLLEETVSALGVEAKLEISRVIRSGISATKVDVWVDGEYAGKLPATIEIVPHCLTLLLPPKWTPLPTR